MTFQWRFFLQNVLQLYQQRWLTLRVDRVALWKIINVEDAVLVPKHREDKFFQRIFALGIFWGGVSRYAASPLIVTLSPVHSDITRFHPWSPIAKGNRLDRAEKIGKLLRRLAPLTLLNRDQTLRDPLHGELPHVQIFMNDGPNPLAWDAQFLSYWFSRNSTVFQDYLANLIKNLRGGHCFGSFRTRHITGKNNHHVLTGPPSFWWWHTMVHVPLMFLSEWLEFPSASCLAEKKSLMTARVSMLLKPRASPDMHPLSLCNKKRLAIRHMNRSLFPKTLSIPSYDMGKYVRLRTY